MRFAKPLAGGAGRGAVREEGVTWASDWVGGGGEQGESFMKRKFWKKNGWKG